MQNLVRGAGLLYDGKLLEKSQLYEYESSLIEIALYFCP